MIRVAEDACRLDASWGERMGQAPNGPPVLGLDLGGTKILAAVVDANHKILSRAKRSTPAREGAAALMGALEAAAREAIDSAGLDASEIAFGGVGSPGPLDVERGYIVRSPNLNVNNFPLAPGLADRLGFPMRAWGDVRVGGYGEYRLGAGRGYQDLLCAFVGTGIGGCLIIRGELVHGSTGNAGEIGHIVLKPGGPRCGCGQRGCMEALASRTAIARRISRAVKRGESTTLADHFVGGKNERIKSKELAAAYFGDDLVVKREVVRAARFLGLGLAGLMNVVGPEVVIVGGGVVEALGQPYIDLVEAAARPHLLADPEGRMKIVAGELKDDAGVLGATLLAREHFSGVSASRAS
jgi:glucokinase